MIYLNKIYEGLKTVKEHFPPMIAQIGMGSVSFCLAQAVSWSSSMNATQTVWAGALAFICMNAGGIWGSFRRQQEIEETEILDPVQRILDLTIIEKIKRSGA